MIADTFVPPLRDSTMRVNVIGTPPEAGSLSVNDLSCCVFLPWWVLRIRSASAVDSGMNPY